MMHFRSILYIRKVTSGMTNRRFIQYRLVDSETILSYLQVIIDIEPQKILDIGMLLKRIGAISRNIGNVEIDENILMDGVDIMPEVDAGVYSVIYDHIFTIKDFLYRIDSTNKTGRYDLTVAYGLADFINSKESEGNEIIRKIITFSQNSSRYLLTDSDTFYLVYDYLGECRWKTIELGDKVSYLALF